MTAHQAQCLYLILPEYYNEEKDGYELLTLWPDIGIAPTGIYLCPDWDLSLEYVNSLNQMNGFEPKTVTALYEHLSGLSHIKFYNA